MDYTTERGRQYKLQVDNSRWREPDVYLRRVWVDEILDGRPQQKQARVFDIGLAGFFGGNVHSEIPEELAQCCVTRILEGNPPPPSEKVYRCIFERKGLRNFETGRTDGRFSEINVSDPEGIIRFLKQDAQLVIEHQNRIGFDRPPADIFEFS